MDNSVETYGMSWAAACSPADILRHSAGSGRERALGMFQPAIDDVPAKGDVCPHLGSPPVH